MTKKKSLSENQSVRFFFCRDEATRTPDPYVPNVVRYQLRYIPIALKRVQKYEKILRIQKKIVLLHTKLTK